MNKLTPNRCYPAVAMALLLAVGNVTAPSVQAQPAAVQTQQYSFDIPAQALDRSLRQINELTGLEYFFSDSAIATVRGSAVKGSYNVGDAIKMLLAGTGYGSRFSDSGSVIVYKLDEQASNNTEVRRQDVNRSAILEEIVVTAQKREQNLQDIPVAVSALTTEDIQKQGIENFEDFARQLPGVNLVQSRKNRAQFVIRGITTGQAGGRSQDEVATYINDISVTSTYFAFVLPDLRLFDVERVEVLRGPQGTFFGSGSLGGAVRVITNKPDIVQFDSAIMVDAGHTQSGGDRRRYSGMVNVPLIENTLAVRAAGYYRDEAGYIDNIGTGKDNANSTLDKGGRVAIQWTPTERLSAALTILAQDSDPEDGHQIDPTLGRYKKSSASPSDKQISELRIYNATVDYDLGFATLSSSTTLSKSLGDHFDSFNLITDFITNTGQESDFTAEEIKLISQTDGPYEWLIGGYYFDQEANQWEVANIKDPASFAQQFNVTGIPSNGLIAEVTSALEAREKALFGEISYHLNEQFTLTGGLRYSKSKMRFVNMNGVAKFGGFFAAALGGGGDIDDVPPSILDQDVRADSSVLTGKASISYQLDDNQMYYLLASRGYRVGQANTVFGPDPIDPVNGLNIPGQFEPDSLWNYELGAKTTWLDGSLRANLALFYIPWDNIQVPSARQTDFATFTGNAGEAVSKGIELETVLWMTESLQLGLNVTVQDAKITDISPQDSVITGVLKGDKLPNSPDFQTAGFAEYTWQVRNGWTAFARLDAQYVDSTVNTFSNQAGAPGVPHPFLAESEAYENVDSSIGLENDKWRLTFYVENLTNNDEFTYISPNFLTNKYTVLRPQTLGMRLNFNY